MKASDIFHKTVKGQAEIETRSRDLSMKQRRVLILVNGANDCSELKRLSLCDDIVDILQTLIEGGFIQDGESTTASIAPQDLAEDDDPKAAAENEAMEFMCNTLLTFANRVRVAKLIEEIKAADSAASLKAMIKPWYMAISETPGGMYQADDLRDQVTKMIDNAGFD